MFSPVRELGRDDPAVAAGVPGDLSQMTMAFMGLSPRGTADVRGRAAVAWSTGGTSRRIRTALLPEGGDPPATRAASALGQRCPGSAAVPGRKLSRSSLKAALPHVNSGGPARRPLADCEPWLSAVAGGERRPSGALDHPLPDGDEVEAVDGGPHPGVRSTTRRRPPTPSHRRRDRPPPPLGRVGAEPPPHTELGGHRPPIPKSRCRRASRPRRARVPAPEIIHLRIRGDDGARRVGVELVISTVRGARGDSSG